MKVGNSPENCIFKGDNFLELLVLLSEVWGFAKADDIERVHLQFCKILLFVKQCTQNGVVYGVLSRCCFQLTRYCNIIKCCKFGNFRENFVFANSYNRHNCDVKNARLGHD